jgi:DNA-binding transcriptional regulator of glucitol operon
VFEQTIINDSTREDIMSLIIWGVTIAIILSILGFVLGVMQWRH